MVSREELRELEEITAGEHYYVSLYLNVDPITNPKGEYITHLKNLIKEAEENTPKEIYKSIKGDIERIESYIVTNKREFKRALVIFSSGMTGLWRIYHLSVPVKNQLVIDMTPCIEPLLDLIDNYPRYLVLIIDKEHGRVFIVQQSEIMEYAMVHTPDVPGKHKKGGWFALAEKNYQRHIDYHVGIHLKEVEKTLEDLLHNERIDIIFVGGHEEARTRFLQILPQHIREKVKGEFNAEILIRPDDVLQKVSPLIQEYERQKERGLLERLITKALKGDAAVLGVDDTITALWEGKVHILVIDRDLAMSGFRCKGCGFLTVNHMDICPYCANNMEEVEHIGDYMSQKALEQGATVEVIAYEKDLLRERGGVGAILRY